MQSQCVTKSFWRDTNITVDVCSHEDLQIPWLVRDELVDFIDKFLLLVNFMWMLYWTEEYLDVPFRFPMVCISRAIGLVWEDKGNSDRSAREFGGGGGSDWF